MRTPEPWEECCEGNLPYWATASERERKTEKFWFRSVFLNFSQACASVAKIHRSSFKVI